ncbi:MAG: TolC family protein, partial [Bacteroidales bacterium]|nr:TolC family protein [Bacteroidales bacterium]
MMIIRTTDNRQRTTDIVHNLIISHKEYKIQSSTAKSQSIIRTIFIYVVLNFLTLPLVAQSLPMTLDDCMAYAVEHSTSVGKKINALDDAQQDYNSSVASLFPSLSASVSGATNFGRSIDPETNNYTNVSTFSNSYGISGSMPLFAGLQGVNTVRAAKVARERGVNELQLSRDEIAMQTMKAYIDVLYYIGTTEIAAKQLEDSRLMLKEIKKLYEIGRKSAAEVAEVESQEANYDYLLTEQQNNLALAKIRLCEIMNYPQDEELNIDENIDIEFVNMLTPMEDV